MVDLVDLAIGLMSGILIGWFGQWLRFRYSLKVEKIKRLAPHLESAYPIVEKLYLDSKYANQVQPQSDQLALKQVVNRIAVSLKEYHNWFENFRESGMCPQFESLDNELYGRFAGLQNFASLSLQMGADYIQQNSVTLSNYSAFCCRKLKRRLSI